MGKAAILDRIDSALGNERLRRAVRKATDTFRGGRARVISEYDWEALREKARALRATAKAGQKLKKAQALLEKGEEERFIDELHTIVREYLGEKYNLPAAGMTGEVVTKLQAEGLGEDRLKDIKEFFDSYDFYRFTGRKPAAEEIRRLQETAGRILAGG